MVTLVLFSKDRVRLINLGYNLPLFGMNKERRLGAVKAAVVKQVLSLPGASN